MRFLLLCVGMLAVVGGTSVRKASPETHITLNVEVGSIQHAVEELSRVSHVKMRVVGPAVRDTVYLHIEDRPLQEVLDNFANAVEGQWKLGQDGSYTLSRDYAKLAAQDKEERTKTLAKLEEWRTKITAGLDQSYAPASLDKIMSEYRVISVHDGEENSPEDSSAVQARRSYLDQCIPMGRAIARCIAKLDLSKAILDDGTKSVKFAINANSMQMPLPSGSVEAMAKLRNETNAWIQELQKHPAPKKKKGKDDDTDDSQIEKDWYQPDPNDTPEEQEQKSERLAMQNAWERTRPMTEGPTNAVISFENSYGNSFLCTLSFYGDRGNLVARHSSYVDYSFGRSFDEKKKISRDVEPSADTRALWTFYNQTEEYSEAKPPAEAIQAMQRYYNDPINNDPLRIGNQELLDSIAKSKGKSVIACLPDSTLAAYQQDFSTDKFLKVIERAETKVQESDRWIEIEPTDRKQHWYCRLDRQSMANFSKEYRRAGKVDMSLFVPLECGEFGYPAESNLGGFIKEMMTKNEWFGTPNSSCYNHLFLSLSDRQWARMQRGEIIPYRELTEGQLQLISKIAFREFEYGYYGGEAPSQLAKHDPTFELPNGILGGGGLGGEIVYDELLVTHQNPPDPKEEKYERSGINLAERKEKYKSMPSMCGMRSYIPKSSLFEFRKQKRYSLKVHLSPGHYYVGDFIEPLPPSNGSRRYRYEELQPTMISRITAHEQILDDKDWVKHDPPPSPR